MEFLSVDHTAPPRYRRRGASAPSVSMGATAIAPADVASAVMLLFLLSAAVCTTGGEELNEGPPAIDWGQWWTYEGISGPQFWGVINPAWGMCRKGRRQSPINLDPSTLLFDPNLTPFSLDKVTVGGTLRNTGHNVEWHASSASSLVNVTGGPLSYTYTLTHARLHYGETHQMGSEHLVDNRPFPGELQLYGYNSQLYKNFSQASNQVYGVVAIAVLIQVGKKMTPELRVLLEGLDTITYGGSSVGAASLVLSGLLPGTDHYLTYDGSLTQPACHETVTWIIPNKPLYINGAMMHQLRGLRQGNSSTLAHAPLANNYRPVQNIHNRTIRTNIHFTSSHPEERCRGADPRLVYKAKTWLGSL